ncbi:MAG: class I tRNA ligase family protein, partial [Bacilli bacterium]|nr:class I tRNA ligase family protein [Bacilli bacterium]
HLEVGARITEHSKKKNPLDFTLWKKTDVGIQWDSPWGKGRPGWHTECVVMINDTLGKLIDIHGGGTDLIFPHNENEIAKSMALNKTHLANYWMHNGRLMIDNEKMSKSLGNFVLLKDLLEKYEYQVIRLFMLSTHYRQPLNYTPESIENAKNEAEKIRSSFSTLQLKLDYYRYLDKDIQALEESYIKVFYEAMDDDFNTANAITVIMNLMKEANVLVRKQDFTEVELEKLLKLYNTFKLLLSILGIEFNIIRLDDETRDLINKRNEARKTKDYETADKIRAILQEKGITI